ncbi:DUF2892 domain-containing protein [Omnitrophica bacterium]|nr:DUF2892 domain-containing protein [Candidatus Omnitrophota bacterium]
MERWIRLIAGTFILISLALAVTVNKWWLILAAFVGVNLIIAAITQWCTMEKILAKFGVKSCCEGKKECSS